MRYIILIEKIQKIMEDYKREVDAIASEVSESQERNNKMINQYQQSYIDSLNHRIDEIATSKLATLRNKSEALLNHYLEQLKYDTKSFFKGTISADIKEKSVTLKQLDMSLSQREFDILSESARGYYDIKILSQMADDMKLKYEFSANDVISDIDRIFKNLEEFGGSCLSTLKFYCGESCQLRNSVFIGENEAERFNNTILASTSTSFFDNMMSKEVFVKNMNRICSVLPENKRKRALTENDKRLIDAIIDSRYPSIAKDQVFELCASSPDIADLLELDERYSGFVNEYYQNLSESDD